MLQVTHDKLEDVPEQYRDLYSEQDGKFTLTGIQGLKTQADIDRQQSALTKERDEHKETKGKLHVWGDLKHDEVTQKLDRFTELEVMAKGNRDEMDAKLEELTEARVKTRLSPVERENTNLKKDFTALEAEVFSLRTEKTKRVIDDAVRVATIANKTIPEAEADILMLANVVFEVSEDGKSVLTKENPYGVTVGLSPDIWLTDMQEKRPHWWPSTVGGRAKGSGPGGGFANNPFTRENWNVTEQGRVFTTQGKEKAEQMAKVAGTTLGGQKPPEKK